MFQRSVLKLTGVEIGREGGGGEVGVGSVGGGVD